MEWGLNKTGVKRGAPKLADRCNSNTEIHKRRAKPILRTSKYNHNGINHLTCKAIQLPSPAFSPVHLRRRSRSLHSVVVRQQPLYRRASVKVADLAAAPPRPNFPIPLTKSETNKTASSTMLKAFGGFDDDDDDDRGVPVPTRTRQSHTMCRCAETPAVYIAIMLPDVCCCSGDEVKDRIFGCEVETLFIEPERTPNARYLERTDCSEGGLRKKSLLSSLRNYTENGSVANGVPMLDDEGNSPQTQRRVR